MKRMAWWVAGLVLIFGVAGAQDTQTEKDELRYKFEKGQTLTLKVAQKIALKLDEIPEEYKEMLGDEPFNMDFKGTVALEVKEVKDDGSAVLEGKFKKMKVTGVAFINDIDYEFDADKPQKDEGTDEGDPNNPFGMDPTQMLKQLATQTLKISLDPLGKMTIEGGAQGAEMITRLLSLNGMMGTLPKDKIAVGDKWKSNEEFGLPGVGQMKINIRAENTYEKKETVGEQECAVIKTKFTVGTAADEGGKDEGGGDPGQMFNLKTKMTGEGEGKTHFALKAGRTAKSTNAVKVKITASMDNPQGGDALEFKATLTIGQENEISK